MDAPTIGKPPAPTLAPLSRPAGRCGRVVDAVRWSVPFAAWVGLTRSWFDALDRSGDVNFVLYALAAAGPLAVASALAAVAVRPGPCREAAVVAFFLTAFWVVCGALNLGVGGLVLNPDLRSRFWPYGFWVVAALTLFVDLGALLSVDLNRPRRCPGCRGVGLIRTGTLGVKGEDRRNAYCLRYNFFWCLICRARVKRLRRRERPWEDASGPEDDAFYFLWTPFGRLRRLPRRRG